MLPSAHHHGLAQNICQGLAWKADRGIACRYDSHLSHSNFILVDGCILRLAAAQLSGYTTLVRFFARPLTLGLPPFCHRSSSNPTRDARKKTLLRSMACVLQAVQGKVGRTLHLVYYWLTSSDRSETRNATLTVSGSRVVMPSAAVFGWQSDRCGSDKHLAVRQQQCSHCRSVRIGAWRTHIFDGCQMAALGSRIPSKLSQLWCSANVTQLCCMVKTT